jgi:hypothetical protein
MQRSYTRLVFSVNNSEAKEIAWYMNKLIIYEELNHL